MRSIVLRSLAWSTAAVVGAATIYGGYGTVMLFRLSDRIGGAVVLMATLGGMAVLYCFGRFGFLKKKEPNPESSVSP
jgi:hypothetical protein